MIHISKQHWGSHKGEHIYLLRMTNQSGSYVELTNYGATLVSMTVPDRNGNLGNVILRYPDLQGYLNDSFYMGATIGRFANRIAESRFELESRIYQLEDNDHGNSNHGGRKGFHKKVFQVDTEQDRIIFKTQSPDMESGYPGEVDVSVHYRWTEKNSLQISYVGSTDKRTVLNITNHAYFNLSGEEHVRNHRLSIRADSILEMREDHVPTGRILEAGGLTFRNQPLSQKMTQEDGTLKGLNICYVLPVPADDQPVAVLSDVRSGRSLEVYTSYPGLMLYTGDYLERKNEGLCLECQYFPDSPNQPGFPSAELFPGQKYQHDIEYKLTINS